MPNVEQYSLIVFHCSEPVSWTQEERQAVHNQLSPFIRRSTVPRKRDCEKCKEAERALDGRDWKSIKYFVKNQIDKRGKTRTA